MPTTDSAKKALRQSLKRRARNLQKKEAYKNLAKKIRKLAGAGKSGEAEKLLPELHRAADKAAKTGVIKKNKAARLKSRLTKLAFPKKTK